MEMQEKTETRKIGRPRGSRDRNNIFLDERNTRTILRALVSLRKELDVEWEEDFERTFTIISSHAINQLGSTQYLEIVGN